MKRVFTRANRYTLEIPAAASTQEIVRQIFKAEEDLWLIGFHLSAHPPTAGDFLAETGTLAMETTLTPNAEPGKDGELYSCLWTGEAWDSTAGIGAVVAQEAVVMFPQGYGVPIKEEGVLNMIEKGWNQAATMQRLTIDVVLYLVRG
ncbi:hypothetical protein ES705_44376 [subsurface metagenome]